MIYKELALINAKIPPDVRAGIDATNRGAIFVIDDLLRMKENLESDIRNENPKEGE